MPGETFDIGGEPPRRQEGGCVKGLLIGCGLLFVLVVAAVVAGFFFVSRYFSFTKDPVQAAQILNQVIECELPMGYEPVFAFRAAVFRMVLIGPQGMDMGKGDPNATLFFVFSASGKDEDAMRKAFEDQLRQQGFAADIEDSKESQIDLDVGGKPMTARKIEGRQDGEEVVLYQLLVKPSVLFVATGSKTKFDQKAMESLLGSIKLDPEKPQPKADQ